MADEIINCHTHKEDTTIKYHVVTYRLDGGQEFNVFIDATDMIDPSDENELKTLADAKATADKPSIIAAALTEEESSNLNGSVTL